MKGGTGLFLGVVIGALAVGGGGYYWLGIRGGAIPGLGSGPLLAFGVAEGAGQERPILYYRNPMGLPDVSPTPKKDPMGMDYIPVYAGEDDGEDGKPAAGGIRIGTEKVQKLGVRTEAAARRTLERIVRAVGRIEPDERRIHTVTPKFEGYVERLHVNITGQPVTRGQPLFEAYSPELVSTQREHALAAQGVEALKDADEAARAGMRQLAEASLQRLRNWDVSEAQIEALARSGQAKRTLTFRSPAAGIVTEKKAVQGMRFMPGEMLYQITDLSSVWVIADVFERDIGQIQAGTAATVRIDAYPGQSFAGTVSYVYPTLNEATRTVPVRIELANPSLALKPAMFAQLELPAVARDAAVTVPASAIMDSGTRRIALVELGEGRFEPREVSLGQRGDEHVEVLDGVREGERVVVAANFLIDAESNLKAALDAFGAPETPSRSGPRAVSHRAEGTVDAIDDTSGTLEISHGPVETLHWPAMTMEFKAAHAALLQGIQPGDAIVFEFVERAPGEWVITAISKEKKADGAGLSTILFR